MKKLQMLVTDPTSSLSQTIEKEEINYANTDDKTIQENDLLD